MKSYSRIKKLPTDHESLDFIYDEKTHKANDATIQENSNARADSKSVDDGPPKIQRNLSLSSFYSHSNSSSSSSALQRAFSMRRSNSSVTERYCRIHDQRAVLASPFDYGNEEDDHERAVEGYHSVGGSNLKKVKNSSSGGTKRILKACKRVFGF